MFNLERIKAFLTICLSLIMLMAGLNLAAVAQGRGATPLASAAGRPAGSYQISDIENINYFSGQLNISIPITTVQGRGESALPISVDIGSSNWSTYIASLTTVNNEPLPFWNPEGKPKIGTVGKTEAGVAFIGIDRRFSYTYSETTSCYGATSYYGTLTRLYAIMPDGTETELRDVATDGNINGGPSGSSPCLGSTNRGRIFVSKDGSAMTFEADTDVYDQPDQGAGLNGKLYFKDGSSFRAVNNTTAFRDKNGNYTGFNAVTSPSNYLLYTDSAGRATTISYPGNEDELITYKGFGGAVREVEIDRVRLADALYTGQTIKTLAQLFPTDLFPDYGNMHSNYDPWVISQITLPNGLSYSFKYNSYGEIERIDFPTGSAVEYDWANGVAGAPSGGVIEVTGGDYNIEPKIYRRVVERRVYENGTNLTSTMTISRPETASASYPTYPSDDEGYVDVKKFGGSQLLSFDRHYYFNKATQTFALPATSYPSWKNGREYKTEILSTQDSSILRRTLFTWQQTDPHINGCQNCDPDNSPVNNPRIIETTEELLDVSPKLVRKTTSVDPNNSNNIGFDQFNNPTDTWDYDWGSNAPGAFLRRQHTTYVTDPDYINYTGSHIRNLPLHSWVSSDAAGNNKASLVTYEYDNYTTDANHAALVSHSNVSGFDSANCGTGFIRRGNPTSITLYADAQNQTGAVRTYAQYDILGNAVKTIDAKGNASTVGYSDNFGSPDNEATTNSAPSQLNGQNTFAFPTGGTNTLGWTAHVQYDYYLGATVNTQDVNGLISKTIYNDPMDRSTQSVSAIGTSQEIQTTSNYDDTNRKVQTTGDLNTLNDNLLKTVSFYDGLGRTTETRNYEADGNYSAVQTQYDALDRTYKKSNPFRHTEIDGSHPILWTTNTFDSLGRATQITSPDGQSTTIAFSGNATTVTDRALKVRRSISNALGQIVRADEPNGSGQLDVNGGPIQPTYYTYDTLGNLTHVSQGAQTRTFQYDSLSKLKQASNPESGTTSYTFDAGGNLKTKRDSRNIKTIYDYDALNRIIKKCYRVVSGSLGATTCASAGSETPEPNTHDVTLTYENTAITNLKGLLTKVTNGFSTTEYTEFDSVGKVKKSKQTTDNTAYNEMQYTYNLSGAMVEETYPSGRVVKNTLDSIGQLLQVQSRRSGDGYWTYADSFTYTAAGAVSSLQLGNGHWESTNFNNRLQPTQVALGLTPNASNILKLEYTYGQWENDELKTNKNNGNLAQQVITVPASGSYSGFTATQKYYYDSLNRLEDSAETISNNQTWRQRFIYDRYGNRSFDEVYTTTLPKNCVEGGNPAVCAEERKVYNPSVNAANNRLSDSDNYSYDDSGNTIADAQNRSFTYDADNKQVEVKENNVTVGRYYYDGDGKRVKKESAAETTIFVYDLAGKLVAEYSTHLNPDPQVSYLTVDNLGTPRVNTGAGGAVVARHDYQPFGEEISTSHRNPEIGYDPDGVRKKFTGYERDEETDLDFAQARYFNSGFGRFSSPDNFLNATRPQNPASWNLYTYVLNNPLRSIDATGEVDTDEKGNVKFDPKGKEITIEASHKKYLDQNGKEVKINGKTAYITISWTAQPGTITANNKTKIDAFKSTSGIQVKITDDDGKELAEATDEMKKTVNDMSDEMTKKGFSNKADCHGTTFAKGQVWINDDQVEGLLKGDGYRRLSKKETEQENDVGIYRKTGDLDENGQRQSKVVHSVLINGQGGVISKGGYGPRDDNAARGPGPGTAWKHTEGVKIEYWTQRPKPKN